MKTYFLVLAILVANFSIVAQSAKIKSKNVFYKYDVYPEFEGFEKAETFLMKIRDRSGVVYSYTEGTSTIMNSDINNMGGLAYHLKLNTLKYDFIFEVIQNSSEREPKKVISYTDPATSVTKFSYAYSANQSYTVKIYDFNAGNFLLKEFTVDQLASAWWPCQGSGAVGGYSSESLLEESYMKNEGLPGFNKRIESNLIASILIKRIAKEIDMVLHSSERRLLTRVNEIKTKDEKFNLLDSALIYIEMGMDQIASNKKADIKGNHHVANANNNFKKAHKIYLKYNTKEYIDFFTNVELKAEYEFVMKTNLYFTYFLLSDFEKANEIYKDIRTYADPGTLATKKNPAIKDSVYKVLVDDAMYTFQDTRAIQMREEALFEKFKKRFKY